MTGSEVKISFADEDVTIVAEYSGRRTNTGTLYRRSGSTLVTKKKEKAMINEMGPFEFSLATEVDCFWQDRIMATGPENGMKPDGWKKPNRLRPKIRTGH